MTDHLKDHWPDHWPVEPLSVAAKARIIARATAGPQLPSWPKAIAAALERALSEWRYGMPYKLAGAAACIALGLGLGLNMEPPHDHDVAGLAFMNASAGSVGEAAE
jgi:hypothetical protein